MVIYILLKTIKHQSIYVLGMLQFLTDSMLKATSSSFSSESNDEVNTHFSVAFPEECTPWPPALLNTTMYCACYFFTDKMFLCVFFGGGGGGVCLYTFAKY